MAGTLALARLVTNLRLEVGQSSNPATGTNVRDQFVYLLNRTQEALLNDYEWPALEVYRDVVLVQAQRFYDYDPDLPFENINTANLIWTTLVSSLEYGVGPEQLRVWNSDVGVQAWPVQRWRHDPDAGKFELWPVPSQVTPGTPSTLSSRVRFTGQKLVPYMVADTDACALPAHILVLGAAAELLARSGAKDAPAKLATAKEAIRRLRIRQSSDKRRPFVMGGRGGAGERQGKPYVPMGVVGTGNLGNVSLG